MFSKIDLSCKVPSVSSNSIFDYLDSKSLASARLVSTKWKTSSSEIWKERVLSFRIDQNMKFLWNQMSDAMFKSDKVVCGIVNEKNIKTKKKKFIELLGITNLYRIQARIDQNDACIKECVKEYILLNPNTSGLFKNLT